MTGPIAGERYCGASLTLLTLPLSVHAELDELAADLPVD